ncbi:23933_t:CDS:2 [Cetraspora pellucida]|uniref:23933_t:CDS:1 n=1 Tax=Cetraspora pellucida TaxID=1433469 RepID=A0A9N8ZJ61_9GLOM|nr:23933_t:CDS:2 [Cetraspora pellucida]
MSNKNHLVNSRPPSYGTISSHGHPQGNIEPHLSLPTAFLNHIHQYPYSSDSHHLQYTSLPRISGWSLVYLLRRPSFFLLSKLVKVKFSTSGILTLLLIGFIEEFVRLVWLYYAREDASTGNNIYQEFLIAYWLGLGWATAEAIYFIIQNFIEIRWYKEEAGLNGQYAEERRELEEILGRPLTKVSAWWAFESTLVYPAAIIHGLLHVVWGYCLPVFGIPKVSYGTLILTLSMFLIGLALFGLIV